MHAKDAPPAEPLYGKLLVERRVSGGNDCDLYKGVWVRSDNDYVTVALKYIRLNTWVSGQDAFRKLVEKTVFWRTLKHPNIVPFYGYQSANDQLILVSSWSDKQCLQQFLASASQELTSLQKIERLRLLHEAASGLVYLHSSDPPNVHGGVQPTNLIITDGVHAAWSDVGLSVLMGSLELRHQLSNGGQGIVGIGYLARELLEEEDTEPTPMSDVYAFGGLMLFTLSGKPPFWWIRSFGAKMMAITLRQILPTPDRYPEIPADDALWELFRACWNDDPHRRPTMKEIMEQLNSRLYSLDPSWALHISQEPRSATISSEQPPNAGAGSTTSLPHLSARADGVALPRSEDSAVTDSDLLPPIEGILTKIEKIGSGGYAQVYHGVWKKTDGQVYVVAIKSIKGSLPENGEKATSEQTELMKRIKRETKIWKAAQHPNILPFYGYKIVTGEALLASRWCQNGSLDSYINKSETLQETEKLRLLSGAARGLAYLHSRDPPIAHGDIKPQNVIITDEVEATLCDFGISRFICDFSTGMTSRNPGAGTIRYQAKELLIDDSPQSTTMSDIYAFGGLILATMSGKPPFYQYVNNNPIILAISTDKTPMPAQHQELKDGDPLWNLMRDCWRPDFARRPSVKHVSETLDGEINRRSKIVAESSTLRPMCIERLYVPDASMTCKPCVPSPSMDDPTPPEGTPPPPPPGQSSGSGSPTDFLKAVIGKRVVVRLLSGVDYRGILSCLDGYMNIALEQTEEHVAGKVTNRYGEAFIRGNNVLYISAAEALN
ncbi:U4/U6-U5 snRNP complex subunit lsm6 [Tulasnella sp. 427]|nr:U4/U6-U5 snRNP complex subunit lsm6 [Tulasnella sp. 427]